MIMRRSPEAKNELRLRQRSGSSTPACYSVSKEYVHTARLVAGALAALLAGGPAPAEARQLSAALSSATAGLISSNANVQANRRLSPPQGWSLVFDETFDGSGVIDTTSAARNWRFEDMQDALHRAGNTGLDELGNTDVEDWQSVRGKRWSAWYDDFHDALAYRENGMLVMRGLSSDRADPTRQAAYRHKDVLTDYASSKLYTVWLDTFSRIWDQEQERHVIDPASPGKLFKYGYFEIRVNFSEMITPGFRTSFWLMPASSDADGQDLQVSNAYDADAGNGVEIDIFEYEYIGESHQDKLVLALQGGAAGKSSTVFDASSVGISLREGFHTIGILWQADKLVWNIDGVPMHEITDPELIPDVYSYLIISREMNSGVKRKGLDGAITDDALEQLPYRPRDPGLYAQNIWAHRDRLERDRVLIDYIRIWQP